MDLPVFRIVVAAALAFQFAHYLVAGARTFVRPKFDDGGEAAGILFTAAAAGVLILAWSTPVPVARGIIALVLAGISITLYEWARHAVKGRAFAVIFSGDVPEDICRDGPYAWIRHPFYASYIVGFTAALVAYPGVYAAIAWLGATWWFTKGARHDEQGIAASPLAEAYADYRRQTGMFLPSMRRRRAAG